jgi:integrase
MADRLLAYIRRVLNWHASRSDDYVSPIVRGMARNASSPRQRILTDDEIRAIWTASGACPEAYHALVKFLLLTGARRAEAAEMSQEELKDGVWVLPGARNKTGLDLARPLSAAALAVIPPAEGRFAFSTTGGAVPIGNFSNHKPRLDAASGVTGWTVHDYRRTARSLMSRAGVPTDHAERCLGHVIGGVRGVYDCWEYLPEKQRAFESLAALVECIVDPQATVVALRGRA